jgi:hypothetical protein
MDMSATTPSVTPVSFEKVFAAIATERTFGEYPAVRVNHYQPRDLADWREIAWAALERKELGDALRRAIEALSAKYREVLFLRDVKNLNTAEAAWILNITVGVARSRLRRARAQVRDGLASGLLRKPVEKTLTLVIPARTGFPANFASQPCRIRFLPRRQRLMSASSWARTVSFRQRSQQSRNCRPPELHPTDGGWSHHHW